MSSGTLCMHGFNSTRLDFDPVCVHGIHRLHQQVAFRCQQLVKPVRTTGVKKRCSASYAVPWQELVHTAQQQHPGLTAGLIVNSTVFTLGLNILLKGLTPAGVAHSWLLGTLVYAAFGPGGYLLVCLYFLLGSAVTKVKLKQKQAEGIAEARSGRRSPGSVWGSGSAGVLCAATALLAGNSAFWQVGFVASFVSKLSDTVSSEIGKAYGKTAYLITTLKRVPRGTEGAVSLEGTTAGIAAAAVFSAVALFLKLVTLRTAAVVAGAAVVANIFESVLGAVLQDSVVWLSNDIVNGIQITLAAGVALVITAYLYICTHVTVLHHRGCLCAPAQGESTRNYEKA